MKKWVEFDLKINFSRTFYHKQGQGFKVRAVPKLRSSPPPQIKINVIRVNFYESWGYKKQLLSSVVPKHQLINSLYQLKLIA